MCWRGRRWIFRAHDGARARLLAGKAQFTTQEQAGYELFRGKALRGQRKLSPPLAVLRGKESVRQKKAPPYRWKTRICAHMNNTPTPPYKSPPRTTSTVFEMGSQEKTQAPVATYIAMTAGTKTESWIIMAGHSSKV